MADRCAMCDASWLVGEVEAGDGVMTYCGGLFGACYMVHWDVVGIAHGEEGIDCAVLVATHGVDDRVPVKNEDDKKD